MTEPQLSEELTGRALDAAVAQVLGWIKIRRRQWYGVSSAGKIDTIPRYSTDPAAALAALEEMRQRGWNARVCFESPGYRSNYRVAMAEDAHPHDDEIAEECQELQDLPVAVCRAIVQAGGQRDD